MDGCEELLSFSPLAENNDNVPVAIAHKINQGTRIWYSQLSKTIHIELSGHVQESLLQIADLTGRIFISKRLYNASESIGVEYLTKGIYVIVIKNKESTTSSKLMIE